MSTNVENQSSNAMDSVKWVLVFVLLAAAVAGNFMLEQMSVLLRAGGVIVLFAVAAGIAVSTVKGAGFVNFAKESRTEVRKVVWPTRQETMQTTMIIVVTTLIVALLLWGLDAVLVRAVGFVTGLEI